MPNVSTHAKPPGPCFLPVSNLQSHRPGSKNSKADALSRRYDPPTKNLTPEPILPPTVVIAPVTWDIMEELQREQQQDPTPDQCPPNRQYVPHNLRPRIMQWVHASIGQATLEFLALFTFFRTHSGGHPCQGTLPHMENPVKSVLSQKHPNNYHPDSSNHYPSHNVHGPTFPSTS